MTESGPDTGSPCVFPFTFRGVTYTECLVANDAGNYLYYNYEDYYYSDEKWCSTQVLDLYEYRDLQESPPNISRWTVRVSM